MTMRAGAVWTVVLLLVGCDAPAVGGDAALADGGAQDAALADGGVGQDAEVVDLCASVSCGDGEACVRGVCIATCGADVSGFDAALGAGLVPVASYCRRADARVVRESGATIEVWDVTSSTAGTTTTFTLSRWSPGETATPDATSIASTTHDTGDASIAVFTGGFLDLDAAGERALFGYTTSETGYPGELFVVTLADESVARVAAPSSFDAAWIDATHAVVTAAGLAGAAAGPGAYVGDLAASPASASQAITGLGAYSGSVIAGPSLVIVGGTSDAFEPHVYAVPRASLEAAIAAGAPLDVTSDAAVSELVDASGAALPSTFSDVHGRIVTTPYGGPLTSYALESSGGEVTLSDARVLATGDTFTDAYAGGAGRILLAHGAGLLLVEE